MHNLIEFIKKHFHWLVFLILESVSMVMLFRFNDYQASVWLTSANDLAARVNQKYSDIMAYINLGDVNKDLTMRNVMLQRQVSELRDALGTTFVIVSHELASIYAIATNSIFLDAGTRTMQACGNPSALVRDPATPETAMLFLTRGLSRHAGEIPDPRRPDITGTAPREGTADEPQRTDR